MTVLGSLFVIRTPLRIRSPILQSLRPHFQGDRVTLVETMITHSSVDECLFLKEVLGPIERVTSDVVNRFWQ